MPNDLRTHGIVLRRTNFGEADRILNFLTPEGKIAALAKSVRKEKSRLAGGIELFSVSDIVIHQGRSKLGTLTGAKMLRFYNNILIDMSRLELASGFLKKLDRAAEQTDNPEYFSILDQALAGLNAGYSNALVMAWFTLNLVQASGEEINLLQDTEGQPLDPDLRYFWDNVELALRPNLNGNIGVNEIKLTRVFLSSKLKLVANIDNVEEILPNVMPIVQSWQG